VIALSRSALRSVLRPRFSLTGVFSVMGSWYPGLGVLSGWFGCELGFVGACEASADFYLCS